MLQFYKSLDPSPSSGQKFRVVSIFELFEKVAQLQIYCKFDIKSVEKLFVLITTAELSTTNIVSWNACDCYSESR